MDETSFHLDSTYLIRFIRMQICIKIRSLLITNYNFIPIINTLLYWHQMIHL